MTDYISHHGIEGQKWGVRNGPPYPLDPRLSNGKKMNKKQLASYARSLSDEELAAVNKRLNAERQYINSIHTPTQSEKTKAFLKRQAGNVTTGVIDATTKQLGKELAKELTRNVTTKTKEKIYK